MVFLQRLYLENDLSILLDKPKFNEPRIKVFTINCLILRILSILRILRILSILIS